MLYLLYIISIINNTLYIIDLSHTPLEDRGLVYVGNGLHKLKYLNLDGKYM